MIVRKEADGSHIIVGQPDHARLSGLMAAHWGNEDFAPPEPRESFIMAAAYHDCGWVSYEAHPLYDVEKQSPPTHQQVPLDAQQLAAFQRGIDWLSGIDAYAGALISRHRTGLWRSRYGAITYPEAPPPRRLPPEGEAFVERNERVQQEALMGFEPARFRVNYQLLQILDLLSLYLCTGEPQASQISAAPTSYSGNGRDGVTLSLAPIGDRRIKVDPYPFDVPELAVGYVRLHMSARSFASVAEFRRAYFGTVPEVTSFTLVK